MRSRMRTPFSHVHRAHDCRWYKWYYWPGRAVVRHRHEHRWSGRRRRHRGRGGHEPDHPLTMWVRRAHCVNDGDSTLHVSSLAGLSILQWTHDKFDDEDAESYNMWYNSDDDTEDWDFDE